MLLAAANRPNDTNTTFTTGGDVSRFQRRTVPARTPDASAAVHEASGALNNMASAIRGGPAPAGSVGFSAGPVVRVSRGNDVTVIPVGAR